MTPEKLAAAGFPLPPAVCERLARFVELLLRENRHINLTAIRTAADVWRLHVCESLALLPLVDELRPRRLLDLGTGGGLPGVPLACVLAELEVTLLDATRRKLRAVERMVAGLGLTNVRTLWGRAETLAHDVARRERFDVVAARAVAALPTLIEYAAGFVRVGGQCWFPKPVAAADAEVAAARNAAQRCHVVHVRTEQFTLPGGARRALVIYRKSGPLSADLPRAPGQPARRPL